MRGRLDLCVVLLALAACGRGERAAPKAERPGKQVEAKVVRPSVGGLTLPRFDDPDHEMVVLDHAIAEWRARAKADPAATPGLIEHLLKRASVLADLDDYVEADRATAAWVAAAPGDPRARKWRAQVDMRLHRFDDARAQIAAARARGMLAGDAEPLLAAIDQATGHAGDALPYFQRAAEIAPSPSSALGLANALADDGRPREGFDLMQRAWSTLRGPTPFAVAGLLFQWGRLFEEAGELGEARDRYELAWRAMPRHHEATTHFAEILAMTGDRDRAIEVLEAALAGPDEPHPESQAVLASLLVQRDPARARALARSARDDWERYVAAEPQAFADHAARFYLGGGETRDPVRALELAQISHDARQTPATVELLERAQAAVSRRR